MLKFDAVALDIYLILKDVDVLFTKILVKILRIISLRKISYIGKCLIYK